MNFKDPSQWCSFFLENRQPLKVPNFHQQMYDAWASGAKRLAVIAPRYFGKSFVYSVMCPQWEIYEGSSSSGLLVSATGALAEKWLRLVKEDAEGNEWIRGRYGNCVGDPWTADNAIFKTPRGKFELMAKGAGKQTRGFHPDWIVCDDLENDEQMDSADQRQKVKEWFFGTLLNTLGDKERLIVVGTLLHPDSLLSDLRHMEGWTVLYFECTTPDNLSIWPEKWPMSALEARKRELEEAGMGHLFDQEFRNRPYAGTASVFHRDWFKSYEPESAVFQNEIHKGLYTVVALDPAISTKDSADYTGLEAFSVVPGQSPTKIYLRDVERGHWTIAQTVGKCMDWYDRLQANAIIIETTAAQEAFAQEFERYFAEQRRYAVVVRVQPDKDKLRRASKVQPMVQKGLVHVDRRDKWHQRFLDEVCLFTGTKADTHDDLVDPFVYALDYLDSWSVSKVSGKAVCVLPQGARFSRTGGVIG